MTHPRELLGKAIGYILNQWSRLIVYLQDGRLRTENNLVENAIRPFVVGRKNWMFSGHPRGTEASAFLYSLIETAKANGLKPYAYYAISSINWPWPSPKMTAVTCARLLPSYGTGFLAGWISYFETASGKDCSATGLNPWM